MIVKLRMRSCLFWKFCTVKNIFTTVCTALTAFLIFKELFSFAVIKPTNTYEEGKELERSDLPEVVICPDPAIDIDNLRKHGYEKTYSYYRGSADGIKLIGWNGGEKVENLSSHRILEDVLVLDKNLSRERIATVQGEKLIKVTGYTNNDIDFSDPVLALRTLAFPYGRCLSVSPPKERIRVPIRLMIEFDEGAILHQNVFSVRIFFMDNTNSLRLYPDEMEMTGPPLKLDFSSAKNSETVYKTKILRTKHVPGDPLLDCKTYTEENPFNDCVHDELLDLFREELECEPPLLAKDLSKMCNKRFNFSDVKDKELKEEFMHLYYHDGTSKCRPPCVKNVYTSRFVLRFPGLARTLLSIVFENTIAITHSKFSIDEQTLLIRYMKFLMPWQKVFVGFNEIFMVLILMFVSERLGGSVSSGRTLLWIFVSIFAATQVAGYYQLRQKSLFKVHY